MKTRQYIVNFLEGRTFSGCNFNKLLIMQIFAKLIIFHENAVCRQPRILKGYKLLEPESIKQAKDMGAEIINIVSNSKLSPAIRLYESLGFEHAPLPVDIDYETADVYMELKITSH